MTRSMLALAVTLTVTSPALAQTPTGFVVTLGRDTVAIERFTRTTTSLQGDVVNRNPRTSITHYSATLQGGRVSHYEVVTRQPGVPAPLMSGTVTLGTDTAVIEIHRGDSTRKVRMPIRTGAVPSIAGSYAFVEQAIMQAMASGKDSLPYDLVGLGAAQANASFVVRKGRDSVIVGYFGFPAYGHIDATGRLLGYDGKATTVKVVVQRVGNVDIEALATRFATMDANGQGLGQLSKRDTVRASVGAAHVMVDYGRPSVRGRVIFGGIVPWNEVWRTGANAATQFSTDVPLMVGDIELTPATYTLWTLPTPSGAKLIINKQHGQWGTVYDVAQDLGRVDLKTESVSPPVEQFTISIVPEGGAARLVMVWDRTQYSVPLVVK
jgi:hypothetical protein